MNPSDPITWPKGIWYKNNKGNVFHKPEADWIRSGKAVCGAMLARPGWFVEDPTPLQRLCKRCLKGEER